MYKLSIIILINFLFVSHIILIIVIIMIIINLIFFITFNHSIILIILMKLLKAIDLYGKIPKGLAEPTSSGAVVSILTLIFLGLMIMNEMIVFNKFYYFYRNILL